MIDTALYKESVHFQFADILCEIMRAFHGQSIFKRDFTESFKGFNLLLLWLLSTIISQKLCQITKCPGTSKCKQKDGQMHRKECSNIKLFSPFGI